ncbi:MAG: hypothetical protein LUQ38_00650 [Methanotrichaceae archaeon]|nr:hypothetical protein [Methanotrichaceae archaeon]
MRPIFELSTEPSCQGLYPVPERDPAFGGNPVPDEAIPDPDETVPVPDEELISELVYIVYIYFLALSGEMEGSAEWYSHLLGRSCGLMSQSSPREENMWIDRLALEKIMVDCVGDKTSARLVLECHGLTILNLCLEYR